MGAKAKFVPSFLVSWLKKTVHEDEVNRFLWESRHLQGTEWLTECVKYLKMNIQLEGVENLPDKNDGKLYTFVSNHPLGGQDGVALGSIIGTHYDGKFRYLVNDLLLNLPGLKPVSIGINKTGRQSRDFPPYGGGWLPERQSHADVPCRSQQPQTARWQYSRLALEKDIYLKECGVSARCGAYPFQRTELGTLLSHRPIQRQVFAFQLSHAFLGRRDVPERGKGLPYRLWQAHTLADLRQEQDSHRMGAICKRQSLRIIGSYIIDYGRRYNPANRQGLVEE